MHDLRRCVGTALLTGGASIEQVSSLLNHSNIAVTQRVYAAYLSDQSEAVDKVASFLSNSNAQNA